MFFLFFGFCFCFYLFVGLFFFCIFSHSLTQVALARSFCHEWAISRYVCVSSCVLLCDVLFFYMTFARNNKIVNQRKDTALNKPPLKGHNLFNFDFFAYVNLIFYYYYFFHSFFLSHFHITSTLGRKFRCACWRHCGASGNRNRAVHHTRPWLPAAPEEKAPPPPLGYVLSVLLILLRN